jgi:hypothetical protein
MPSPDRAREPQPDTRRKMSYFIEIRRKMLRYARSIRPGAERNQHRQIALSLRSLFRNKTWRESHTLDD